MVICLSVGLGRLGEGLIGVWSRFPLTREALAKLRLKALRYGVWFRKLSRDERTLLELVIRVTDKVRSFLLAKLLSRILNKLLEAMGGIQVVIGQVAYKMKTDGLPLALRLSQIGQSWGNRSAARWPTDLGFVRYLTIMCMNRPP